MTGEFDRESFSAWLGRVHTDRLRLAQESRDAEAHSAASRVALAHRRVAEAAAEEALAREMTARASELARRDQVMLEDVARVLRQAENER
jgi:hypothetical protein